MNAVMGIDSGSANFVAPIAQPCGAGVTNELVFTGCSFPLLSQCPMIPQTQSATAVGHVECHCA